MRRDPLIPARLRDVRVARRRDEAASGTVLDRDDVPLGRVHARWRTTPAPGARAWTAEVAGYSLGTRYRSEAEAVEAVLVFHASYPDLDKRYPGYGECIPAFDRAGRWVQGGRRGRRNRNHQVAWPHVREFLVVWRVVRGF